MTARNGEAEADGVTGGEASVLGCGAAEVGPEADGPWPSCSSAATLMMPSSTRTHTATNTVTSGQRHALAGVQWLSSSVVSPG